MQICVTGDNKELADGFLRPISTKTGYLGLFGHSIVSDLVCLSTLAVSLHTLILLDSWCGQDLLIVGFLLQYTSSCTNIYRSAIVDSLQKTFTSPNVATVFIFCQDPARKEQTSIDLLRNILAQLVYRKRGVSSATASLYHSESLIQGKASAKTYQNAIRAEVNRFSKVFFVIDGLDMFYDKERILSRLQKLPAQAQMLVTLREASYSNDNSYLNVLAPPEDIQLYTLSRILLDPAFRSLFEGSPVEGNLEEEVIRSVVERSHGL